MTPDQAVETSSRYRVAAVLWRQWAWLPVCCLWLLFSGSLAAQNTTDTVAIDQWNAESFEVLSSDTMRARMLAEKALQASRKLGYNRGLSDAYMRFGLLEKNAGRPDSALQWYHQSLGYRRKMQDPDLIARACSNIGTVYHQMAVYDSAIYYHLESVRLGESIRDTAGLIKYTNNTGIAFQKYKDYPHAIQYYAQSIALSEATDNAFGVYRAAGNLASVYIDMGDAQRALRELRPLMREQYAEILPASRANVFNNAGLCWQELGRNDSAIYAFKEAIRIAEGMVSDDMAGYLSNLGLLLYQTGKFQEAEYYLLQSIDMAHQTSAYQLLYVNYQHLGLVYSANRNFQSAADAMTKALAYADTINWQERQQAVEEMREKYAAEKRETEIENLKLEQQLTALDRDRQRDMRNLVIAAGIGAIILLILIFNRRSLRRKIDFQHKLTGDRTRISADLHDDIGSALSSISMYSELAKEKAIADPALSQYLTEISGTSRDLLDSMGDLVWAVNPANDSMEKILSRIQSFGTRICMPGNIGFVFSYDPALEEMDVDMEVRHCMYMIVKEAVNNAVKYASAHKVFVEVRQQEQGLQVRVYDDGMGFDVEAEYEGNGLRNMRRRAEQIHAEMKLFSRPGKETGLELVIPLPHRRNW